MVTFTYIIEIIMVVAIVVIAGIIIGIPIFILVKESIETNKTINSLQSKKNKMLRSYQNKMIKEFHNNNGNIFGGMVAEWKNAKTVRWHVSINSIPHSPKEINKPNSGSFNWNP